MSDLTIEGVDAQLASVIQSQFCAELATVRKNWHTICPDDSRAMLEMAKLSAVMGACQSDDCVKQVADPAEADEVVEGKLWQSGPLIAIELERLEPGSKKSLRKVSELLPADADLMLKKLPALAQKLAK